MDDDVKNLFQKFGQSTDAYREINRDADSELAKQRWPLLRDVHLHAAPATAPVRAVLREEEITPPAPVHQNENAFRPAAVKSTASRATLVKATSATPATPVATNTAASNKSAVQLPLKQLLMQPPVAEEPEIEPAPAPAFLSSIMPAAQRKNVSEQKSSVASSLFGSREQAINGHEAAPAQSAIVVKSSRPVFPAQKPAKPAEAPTPTATPAFLQNIAGHAMPEKLAAASNEDAVSPSMGNTAAKEKPVSSVFGRLAGKQEEAKPASTPTNSFFNKIFKP
ncbi:cellulose biosynthesis protein BcsP [Undibacterium sp. Di27W]|uniref:cellulose biosynthesis protein BcsP n=1 Tax=Undibacterium sp. Di27W TaxID=3413036 RepID=UPI003BEFD471